MGLKDLDRSIVTGYYNIEPTPNTHKTKNVSLGLPIIQQFALRA